MHDMTRLLDGKSVLVVGCASGIGAGSARLLARAGARLVLGDIDEAGAARVAAAIRAEGGTAIARQVDIADEAAVNALAAYAVECHGGIDGLANIAAATHLAAADSQASALEIGLDLWDRTMAVNLRGFLLTMRAAVPAMLRRGGGAIVNISSISATNPQPYAGAYSTSKAAIDGLTRHVAAAYGRRGIRCNAVAPGPIATPENQLPQTADYFATMRRYLPSPRIGTPDDVGALVTFLLSDGAGFINGEVVRADGGALCYAPWSAENGFAAL